MASGVVVQLGIEMMPSCHSTSAPFTSGMTSGTFGCIRNALPSSITRAPRLTASGASALLTDESAEMNATAMPSKASGVASMTVSVASPYAISLPAERCDAIATMFFAGQSRSSRSCSATEPTAPVAPTMAIRMFWSVMINPEIGILCGNYEARERRCEVMRSPTSVSIFSGR